MERAEKRLLMKRPSEAAVKLANSIYFTAIQEEEFYIFLPLSKLCKIVGNCSETDWYAKIVATEVLDELAEPVAVENFTYDRKEIKWQAMSFISYSIKEKEGKEYVEIVVNEMFVEVMKQLEAEPYINFQ